MPVKVLALVNSCGSCPNNDYDSGGTHRCRPTGALILDKSTVAPFCPLADYPADSIVGMQRTIQQLREPNTSVLSMTLIGYLATKLKLNLDAGGRGITIPYKDGNEEREVVLDFDYVSEVGLSPSCVAFLSHDRRRFKLFPDAQPPTLEEAMERDIPGPGEKDLWMRHSLP